LSNNIKPETKYKYQRADKYVEFNKDDKVLATIRYNLPKQPKWEEIDGYGLDPKEQMWKIPQIPMRLKQLQKSTSTLEEIREKLFRNQKEYAPEIAWIKQEWDRRINGYWLYINGKATYMDGWHYFYCGYWHLDTGLPDYRERDYLFFHFARFCYTETKLPDGSDMLRRLCYGFNYPKHRREGATYKAECINYEIISRTRNAHGGIQSMDGDSAKDAFLDKLIAPWQKLPFFFKPKYTGSTTPKSVLNFDEPAINISSRGGLANVDIGLQSKITYASTANRGFYDGKKLLYYHDDETGKTNEEDVYMRHMVTKKCLSQANGRIIHGLTIKTSTVGEMSKHGGNHFYKLCKDSMYEKRNENGETVSGLYNLFIPAYVCLDGFIDIFGNAIVEDPSEDDLWRIPMPTRSKEGKLVGAKRYLNNIREAYLSSDDSESQEAFEEEMRLYPTSFDECFITSGADSGLPIPKIIRRVQELQFITDKELGIETGNFEWLNDQKDTTVVFKHDKQGKFRVSHVPNNPNQKFRATIFDLDRMVNTWKPLYGNLYTASADPFSFLKTQTTSKNRLSKGAGNVFMERNESVDDDDKPIESWETYRNVCTYSTRVKDPDDYAEDMLMMCVFYGAMMYPEINVDLIWKHFRRRGYLGYLKYGKDPSGRKRNTPGFYNKGAVPQDLFTAHKRYLENHCDRERHIEILLECKEIKGVEDLTNRDLFVAVGGSYLGSEHSFYDYSNPLNNRGMRLNSIFPKKKY
jgi:hypothetical protein